MKVDREKWERAVYEFHMFKEEQILYGKYKVLCAGTWSWKYDTPQNIIDEYNAIMSQKNEFIQEVAREFGIKGQRGYYGKTAFQIANTLLSRAERRLK